MMADKTTPGGVLHDPVNGKRLDEPSAVNLDARLREVSTEAGDEADRAEAAAKDAAASAARAEAIVPGIEAEVRAVVLASPELKGEPGAPGPAPSIKIGTVTSGATPSATIKGTSPDLTLDLVLPQPAPGAVVDPYSIRGPGRPDVPSTTGGVITGAEPVGAEYRSMDGANVGAWTWRKRPTGWAVTDGDTGWRELPAGITSGTVVMNRVRRVGQSVFLMGRIRNDTGALITWPKIVNARPASGFNIENIGANTPPLAIYLNDTLTDAGWTDVTWITSAKHFPAGANFFWRFSWTTADAWPTAPLPGTPA